MPQCGACTSRIYGAVRWGSPMGLPRNSPNIYYSAPVAINKIKRANTQKSARITPISMIKANVINTNTATLGVTSRVQAAKPQRKYNPGPIEVEYDRSCPGAGGELKLNAWSTAIPVYILAAPRAKTIFMRIRITERLKR
jgi:hypothetical protein